jgi:hypothetical protein
MSIVGSLPAVGIVVLLAAGAAAPAFAQSEDVEARDIGRRGVTLVGIAGSVSRFFSSEDLIPGSYTVQVDAHRFLFDKVALRVGVVGTGRFGGSTLDDDDDDDDQDPNVGTPAIEALGGALYYFTPASIWSFYGGGEYRARLTERLARDAGSINGVAGLQGALSSRASFFVEGSYGMRLQRGGDGELLTRMAGQAGVRVRF